MAAALANVLAAALLNRGRFVPRGDAPTRMATARPAGLSRGGRKALVAYGTRYTHVLTPFVIDKNLARLAQRRAKRGAA